MTSKVEKTRGWQVITSLLEGKTQSELAGETGVSQPTISAVVNLQRLPGLDAALEFAKLGIEPSWWREPPCSESGEHAAVDPESEAS